MLVMKLFGISSTNLLVQVDAQKVPYHESLIIQDISNEVSCLETMGSFSMVLYACEVIMPYAVL